MSLLQPARYKFCCKVLTDFEAAGVRYKVVEGRFQLDGNTIDNIPNLRLWIDSIRGELAMTMRRQKSLCLVCGKNRATRPRLLGPTGEGRDWCETCWREQIAWTVAPLMQIQTAINEPSRETVQEQIECLF